MLTFRGISRQGILILVHGTMGTGLGRTIGTSGIEVVWWLLEKEEGRDTVVKKLSL